MNRQQNHGAVRGLESLIDSTILTWREAAYASLVGSFEARASDWERHKIPSSPSPAISDHGISIQNTIPPHDSSPAEDDCL